MMRLYAGDVLTLVAPGRLTNEDRIERWTGTRGDCTSGRFQSTAPRRAILNTSAIDG
jgi:hypothetical protein